MKIYYYPSPPAEKKIDSIANRGQGFKKKDIAAVNRIIQEVRKEGDRALVRYTRQYDAPEFSIDTIAVKDDEIKTAVKKVDRDFNRTLKLAIDQIEAFHQKQKMNSWFDTDRAGTLLGQMVNPVDIAGIYTPGGMGGKTPLVSSVLMCAIPARIAGVGKIIMVTPPTRDGSVNPHLLVAAKKAGVHKVFKVGSAWSVAALAFGTETIPKADVIVGPGNIFVTLAKKLIAGSAGIDMIAGPSEVLVIADRSANPEFVAADLLSQAEHDVLASAVLITDSGEIAERVSSAVAEQLQQLHRKDIAQESIRHFGGILVVPDLESAFKLSNRLAPEHLELHIENPLGHMGRIRNAGAVFMGQYTPEPVGDYIAGPNHVLPTAGTARFSSALSVDHFIKKTNIVHYSKEAFSREAGHIIRLAEIEGLGAHANAVKIRMKK